LSVCSIKAAYSTSDRHLVNDYFEVFVAASKEALHRKNLLQTTAYFPSGSAVAGVPCRSGAHSTAPPISVNDLFELFYVDFGLPL
jgi:hypothetical protein